MCGGDLFLTDNKTVCKCEYCGATQTVSATNDEVISNLYNRANNLRRKCEFDKAEQIYEKIVQKDDSEAEAHWGIVLCKFGIEYVEDPVTYERIPTCHRTSFESIKSDADYLAAIDYSDIYQQSIYETEARNIDKIQKGILEIVDKEKPFDVFICYKETDENGKRTVDSVIANDIYYQLTQEGLKVFYSAITLEDKLGQEYEPYIFSALNSAKVMLVIGTKPEYFNAVWVKNEWFRFLKLMKADREKLLIPCFRDMDAYDLPEEFSHLQAQDMSKIGFINDVIRGINKILSDNSQSFNSSQIVLSSDEQIAPLLKRVYIFLEDEEWSRADDFCEKILNINPELAEAYLCKLMIEFKCSIKDDLFNLNRLITTSKNYLKIIRYGNEAEKCYIQNIVDEISKNSAKIEAEHVDKKYCYALEKKEKAKSASDYKELVSLFEELGDYKRSKELIGECNECLLDFYKINELECPNCGETFPFNKVVTEAIETTCPHCRVTTIVYPFDDASNDEYVDVICPNCEELLSYTNEFLKNNKGTVCPFCNNDFLFDREKNDSI